MTPRKAQAVCLLLPLTLAVPLLWRDVIPAALLPRLLTPQALAALALGWAAFALALRYFRPGYSVEPNRWGLVVGLAAVGIYFLGSVRSEPTLHWAAGGLLYLGGALYLGGPYFAVVTLPAAFATTAAASGVLRDTFVEVPLLAVLALYIAATFRLDRGLSRAGVEPCPHLSEHADGTPYCAYCGKMLTAPRVAIGRAKLGPLLLASLLILALAVAQPVAFSVTRSGISYTTYTAAGIHPQPLIESLPPGWKVANTTAGTSAAGTAVSYDLASARSNVSLLVTLSTTTYHSPSIVPANFSKATPTGSVQVDNQTLTEYGLTSNGSAGYTGLVWSAPVSYLSGGRVSTGMLSFLAAQPTATYNATGGKDLATISSSLLHRVGPPQSWSLPLAIVGSPVLQYSPYIFPSVALIAVVLFVGSLRGRELRDSKVVDNSFGLTSYEFSLFATLARARGLNTGAELEAAVEKKGIWHGGDFGAELSRLERLALMSGHVRVRGGVPRLLWRCELA